MVIGICWLLKNEDCSNIFNIYIVIKIRLNYNRFGIIFFKFNSYYFLFGFVLIFILGVNFEYLWIFIYRKINVIFLSFIFIICILNNDNGGGKF